jgi:chromosome segregation ATPase
MEKINKLAEKEARITADRLAESRKYLDEDRDNLIKYMKKYGFEAEFETDGFLANYEEAWTKVYEEIAALYEDNLLTEEEEKIEEELNVKLEELEGALEDYENSLAELAEDIEKYEESLYAMYDSKLEQLEHRLEFRLELNEDDMYVCYSNKTNVFDTVLSGDIQIILDAFALNKQYDIKFTAGDNL